ncbi:hypothetical protein, partial [Lentzea flava]|uniref:hypothetical protein n=1 Tax=Lentzea flava TaxID=103732 RepID=UPI00166FE12B
MDLAGQAGSRPDVRVDRDGVVVAGGGVAGLTLDPAAGRESAGGEVAGGDVAGGVPAVTEVSLPQGPVDGLFPQGLPDVDGLGVDLDAYLHDLAQAPAGFGDGWDSVWEPPGVVGQDSGQPGGWELSGWDDGRSSAMSGREEAGADGAVMSGSVSADASDAVGSVVDGVVSSGGVSLPDEVRLGLTGWRPDPGGGDKFTDAISRIGRGLEGAVSLDRRTNGKFVSELTRGLLSEWSWKMSRLDDPVTGKPYTLSKILEVSGVQITTNRLYVLVQDWRVRMSAVLLPPEVRGAITRFRPGVEGRSTLPEFVASLRGRGVSLVSSVSPGFVLHPSTEA